MTLQSSMLTLTLNDMKVAWKICHIFGWSPPQSEPCWFSGHIVGQFHLVMHPLNKTGKKWPWTDRFIAYVQYFDIIAKDITQLPILKHAKQAFCEWLGDAIPLSQVWAFAHLISRFGPTADTRLTAYNSVEHLTEFYLNKYFNKNTYFVLSYLDRLSRSLIHLNLTTLACSFLDRRLEVTHPKSFGPYWVKMFQVSMSTPAKKRKCDHHGIKTNCMKSTPL